MRTLTLILFITLISNLVYGQGKSIKKDKLLFEKALSLQQLVNEELDLNDIINSQDGIKAKQELAGEVKQTILDKALEYYEEIINNFPKSKFLFRALNNKGFIELELDYEKEAKDTFLTILNSNADDSENGGVGSGIMGEPYATAV